MNQVTRILTINGSYREDGITDQAVDAAVRALQESGAEVETIRLREQQIEFCLNCRTCTQEAGESPGHCVHRDGMRELLEKIERADGYVLAAPTNFGSVTAIFQRFLERLIVYAYWPWGVNTPVYRKAKVPRKKAILISSCAAPGLMGRLMYGTNKQLKTTAQLIGADVLGMTFTGLIAGDSDTRLPARMRHKAESLARKLN